MTRHFCGALLLACACVGQVGMGNTGGGAGGGSAGAGGGTSGGSAGGAAGGTGGGGSAGGAAGGAAGGSAGGSAGEIIPADRLYDWSPGTNVGVPGGIRSRSTLCATVDAATYGTGTVDASAAILAALNGCAAGQVVFLPAGTYRLDNPVDRVRASNVTLRGAGVGQTILKANKGNMRMLWLGDGDYPRPTVGAAVTGGARQGSSTVTLDATPAGVKVDGFVRLEQSNPPYVISAGSPTTDTKVMSIIVRVTALTATSVTFRPPLPFALTGATLIPYARMPMVNTGIEDLTFDASGALTAFQWEHAWGCWVKNIEVKNSASRQMILVAFLNGEIRQSYFHDVVGGGRDHEGITLTADDHFNLVEDNISYNGGFPAIVLGDGPGSCHGNVVGYNFAYATDTSDPDVGGTDISVNHGPHNAMNLFEGNISSGFASDGYHGSASHAVVFRNWFTATHPTATQNLMAMNLGRWSTFFSIIGNVLGNSAFPATGQFMPEASFAYTTRVIYKVGFPNMGNNGFDGTWGSLTGSPDYRTQSASGKNLQERDLYVQGTMLRHGNYDFANKATQWDSAIAQRTLPDSLYRPSVPAFWPAGLAWPSIGPDKTPMVGDNAAFRRFKAMAPAAVVPVP